MAAEEALSLPSVSLSASSYDTALCLIPPRDLWPSLNRVRSLYDQAYATWPPHVNLVYPFVRPEALAEAARVLCLVHLDAHAPGRVSLSETDTFTHKGHSTVLRPARSPDAAAISRLRHHICRALGLPSDDGDYQPHMTVAQSDHPLSDSHSSLLDKARLLVPLSWDVSQLVILVREPSSAPGEAPRRMKLWGHIDIMSHQLQRITTPLDFPLEHDAEDLTAAPLPQSQTTYRFDPSDNSWNPLPGLCLLDAASQPPDHLIIASYNTLAEFAWPPDSARYPALLANILSARAAADILVLQEVTDHFLPFLLDSDQVCARYPYATHRPPGSPGVGPLPSLPNVVVLSRLPFRWQHLPFRRKHKGAAVLTLPTIQVQELGAPGELQLPLVLAACHLSQGLVDGAVVAKKNELQRLLSHLSTEFPRHPWIIAGDFNLATSSYTIDLARRKQDLSPQCFRYFCEIEPMLSDAGLQDAWLISRIGVGESSNVTHGQAASEDLYEGEQGATFDPLANHLAARAVGSGLNNRPQRYDRILVSRNLALRPCGFNMFGEAPPQASDHWGIRCLLKREESSENDAVDASGKSPLVHLHKAPPSLCGIDELKTTLSSRGCLPTRADEAERKAAVSLLEKVLLGTDQQGMGQDNHAGPGMVLLPVGSFGLGVWTTSSDINCLCVGAISSKTFFAVAAQRLKKAAPDGITILRRVRANSGTMLELDIRGFKFDLQYCPAASIAERYPEVMKRPSSDPAFALPVQTLAKLKPARDLYYLRKSVPDMAKYRLAHLLIKAWAMSRGLYAPKFGLLGGIHIAVMLVPVCKSLANGNSLVSTSDIVTSFFHHYAEFDFKSRLVFDPFFHKDFKYHRTFREPLCLLGWHAPSLNTATNASAPTVHTISVELARARDLFSREGMTWNEFLGSGDASASLGLAARASAGFLQAYKSYVKIDARYWGSSPTKGKKFLAWLESRCVMVLVDMNRQVPAISTRIWPARFVQTSSGHADKIDSEYHGCYLVGLEWQDNGAADMSKDEAKHAERALDATLREFETRIREDEKYYDKGCCWMMASVASGHDLGEMQPDSVQWGTGECGETDSEEDLDMEAEDEGAEGGPGMVSLPGEAGKQKPITMRQSKAHMVTKPTGLGKFRTAADVMNRLRWDAAMDASDYLVGYEDRFMGPQERALEQWKSELTDDEFIPQHRILYFKRRSDGVVVWERRTRTDDVFGSGI
ncbi:Nuclear poly(A) polymerase 4 [Tolypocladium capitatum]|uniref:polynucleotide adenylyltransferase n=1 Tax=Tolypocladium capitatum TaxID=45235 RepID=A0A2K3QAA5_9HYPO|nr:Nuclear poly(A) polymerase 4 [Tolypocladium capitatum]